MSARESFTRGGAIDSPPVQQSLRKQSRDPRRKQAEEVAADHSWHSERRTKTKYKQNWGFMRYCNFLDILEGRDSASPFRSYSNQFFKLWQDGLLMQVSSEYIY